TNPAQQVNVGLAIGNDPSSGTLSNGGAIPSTGGVAQFPTASIDKAGRGYTLVASVGASFSATSGAFDVLPAGAKQLVFRVAPGPTTAGLAFPNAVQVAVVDANNNIVTTSSDPITMSFGSTVVAGSANL